MRTFGVHTISRFLFYGVDSSSGGGVGSTGGVMITSPPPPLPSPGTGCSGTSSTGSSGEELVLQVLEH